jgi:hypothetical protein
MRGPAASPVHDTRHPHQGTGTRPVTAQLGIFFGIAKTGLSVTHFFDVVKLAEGKGRHWGKVGWLVLVVGLGVTSQHLTLLG